MPTYEYLCRGCGIRFTVVQSIRDDKLERHEACGGELERLIGGGRLLLTPRKGAAPDDNPFPDTPPGGWDDDGLDAMGGMGMDAMGGMGGMGMDAMGMGAMGMGMDDAFGEDADCGFDGRQDDGADDFAPDDLDNTPYP